MTDFKSYQSPLSDRYASQEMSFIFSPYFKYCTWRKLWVALAKAQKTLGLPITLKQIQELEAAVDNIDMGRAQDYEKQFRHDVMAHIHTFADACPSARSIIHWGATSCYVTDNADLIQIRQGLYILRSKVVQVIRQLSSFAEKYASLSCLSYTHFQSAQPTTVGKRACLWIQDFLIDLAEIEHVLTHMRFLGVKGATGTQASFLALFEGDHERVKKLEELVAQEMEFSEFFSISGQTYTRKQDIRLMAILSSFASSTHKFATDLRLLSHLKEIEEPFAKQQIGSSAMPYKRNPMRSERICGLARFLISLNENALYTEATQWFERTLDDSANRRLYLPEAFLTADAILNLLCNVTSELVIHPKIIQAHLSEELPFLATETILMEAVKRGKDRQHIHEKLRLHSLESSRKMKEQGDPCDLLGRIIQDEEIGLTQADIDLLIHPEQFIGRAVEQTREFLNKEVYPVLTRLEIIEPYIPQITL